jgi:tetratricopeptide (TPR) repeat protein/tRNA A-37 threonylcarbamoyl transferase component Bud32
MPKQELYCDNCGAANPPTARFCQYCAQPLPFVHTTGTLPGQTLLNNRYQLERLIGQGGMGAVYKAMDTTFNNRLVAIKEMSRAGLADSRIQEAEQAFQREASLLTGLLHPNLPRIYDSFTEEERSYLVMDFIEGETLDDYLEKAGGNPLPLEQVLKWGEELCDVLSYLHDHQPPIIFRDLKPSNVMIDKRGHIFLIDFGIARIFKPGKQHDTVALGSPGYAAPEQYGKAQSTPRSDIYSLGALLHYLLTGVDPSEQPFFFRPASQLNPKVPLELENLLKQMLEMNAEHRPASMHVVADTLRQIERQLNSGTLTFSTSNPVVSKKSDQATMLLQDAYALYAQKRLREAITAYDRVLKVDDKNALAWQGRGLTQALAGMHREALSSFEHALQCDQTLTTSWNGKGAALANLSRPHEALDAFEHALVLEPDNALAWDGKGAALSALGQPEQALAAFEKALHYDQYMAQAWNNKGLVLRQLRRYEDALRSFEQAISLGRGVPMYWNGKGLVLQDMGRLKEASQAFQEALNCDGRFAPAWYGLGNVFYAQQKVREALDAYDRACQCDPRFVRAWDRRGNVLTDLERFSKAMESYDEALRIDPRYAPAWNGKANVLCLLGRYQEALAAYEHALRINPNAPLAWNGKGNAYFHMGDYQRSLDAYERATQLYPRMASAWYNKSLVLKYLRRYEEALAAAEEAIRLVPNDADNWQSKAEILRKLARRKEARTAEAEVARLQGKA